MPKDAPVIRLTLCLALQLILWQSSLPAGARPNKEADELKPARVALLSITAEEAQAHVDVLASDDFEGRKSGTLGQRLAAKYIANEFSEYGLTPAGVDGSYYQDFQIVKGDIEKAELRIHANRAKKDTPFLLNTDFIPFSFSGEAKVTAQVVFAGYGITAREYGYDDYEDIDVTGKFVLVLRHEPQEHDRTGSFRGKRLTRHAYFRTKAKNAVAHGAVGMLLVTDPMGDHDSSAPVGYWPSLNPDGINRRPWVLVAEEEINDFPAVWVSGDVAEGLVSAAGYELSDLQRNIDRSLQPDSFEVPDLTVTLQVDLDQDVRETRNVIALLEGSDPILKDEVIVIGAHYDHLGKRNGKVYNGADDNASGTAGVLEIAEAFTQSDIKPRRSVLFVAFAAEEMGLLGSEYYVTNPPFDLDQTVFMLNLDMIGRNEPNQVTVVGSNRSPEVHRANMQANAEIGLSFGYDGEKYFSRSDHAHFARHRIPILFYNTEVHEDYHRTSDTADKINSQKVARISRLAFLVAWQIANAEDRPTFKRFRINRSSR